MKRHLTILFIGITTFGAAGQQNAVNLSGNYSYFHHSDFLFHWDGGGLNLGYQRAFSDHFSVGLEANWLLFESSNKSLEEPSNPNYPTVKYTLIAVKSTLFYYFAKQFKGLYCGVSLTWEYLSPRTKLDDSNPYYIYFTANDSSAGAGFIYGYRYQFPSGFGLYAQGSHDWSYFNSNGIVSQLHQWGAGAFKVF